MRTAYLDATRAYFNGAAVFLCPEGLQHARCERRRSPRLSGDDRRTAGASRRRCRRRRVARRLRRATAPPNYDELIDHPVEIADFATAAFAAGGVAHDIAVTGRQRGDLERLARDLARICQWQIELFGGSPARRPPFDRYLFQIAAVGDGYGGLEHRVEHQPRLQSRRPAPPGRARHRRRLPEAAGPREPRVLPQLERQAHQARRVRALRPRARELHAPAVGVRGLHLLLRRPGAASAAASSTPRSYLELLGARSPTVLRTPGPPRARASPSRASTPGSSTTGRTRTRPTPSSATTRKGALVALALDLTLRAVRFVARRADARAVAALRAAGHRRPRGRHCPPRLRARRTRSRRCSSRATCDGTEDPPLAELLRGVGDRRCALRGGRTAATIAAARRGARSRTRYRAAGSARPSPAHSEPRLAARLQRRARRSARGCPRAT